MTSLNMGPDFDRCALIIVDMQGNKISGRAERTSEIAMHTTIYGMRPDIKAVVHAHPPVATGFAAAGRALNLALLPEVVIGLGCVPLADYGLPGTPALTEPMLPLIPKYDALLMANHGAVCYGEDVFKAYFRMETMEHFQKPAWRRPLTEISTAPLREAAFTATAMSISLGREAN